LPGERLKVAIGTSLNGQIDVCQPNFQAFTEGGQIWPWAALEYPAHAATSHVAIDAKALGQTTTFATACAAGLDAVGWAADEVRNGNATAVLAGATETPLSEFILMVFHSVGVLSKWQGPPEEASRPFDLLRAGLVLAEGAAVVSVESEQDVSRAIAGALRSADLRPHDVDFICAHGNAMQDYDAAETAGIKRVFGHHAWNVPVSSAKSMCGQALAASSAIQVVTACLALRHQIVPPTINYRIPDPSCDLDYVPNVARPTRVRNALIHAHSLGGSHVAMVLGTPD